jgi:hypothetical protein
MMTTSKTKNLFGDMDDVSFAYWRILSKSKAYLSDINQRTMPFAG